MTFGQYNLTGREYRDMSVFFQRLAAYKVADVTWHENWYYSPEQQSFFERYERQMDDALDGVYLLAEGVCSDDDR